MKTLFIVLFTALVSWAQKPLSDTTHARIVCDGNSEVRGDKAGNTQNISQYLKTTLTPYFKSLTVYSYGVNGQTLQDMMNDMYTQICPLTSNKTIDILIASEDINSLLNNGVSYKNNFIDFSTYFTIAKEAGYEYNILWTSGYPRKVNGTYPVTWVSSRLQNQKNFFDTCNVTPPKGVDKVVDMRGSLEMGGIEGQPYDPLYFADYVHATKLGNNVRAQYIIDNGIAELFDLRQVITGTDSENINVEPTIISYYTLTGIEIKEPTNGLFIACYSNGKRTLTFK